MLAIEVQNRILQFNPWLRDAEAAVRIDRFLPPAYVVRNVEGVTLQPDQALLVVGPRQSGKSTMIWHQLKKLAPQLLFLTMEDPLLRVGCTSVADFIAFVEENRAAVRVIFIDEIQHMEEAGLFVKGIVDARLKIPLVVTGSSSFHLRSRTRESLAGRAMRRRLLPFSLDELLVNANPATAIAKRALATEIVTRQMAFGSYPAIYLSGNDDARVALLSDLVESLILRDASDLFKVKRIDAFRRLLTLLAGQIGDLVNFSELASVCNADVGTLNNHVEILEENHIVQRVFPFAGGKRVELTSVPKVYFIDCGIRNRLLNNHVSDFGLRTDAGHLFENWVFSELCKGLPLTDPIKFWRSKAGAEVDFVIEHAAALHAVEAKFSAFKRPVISRSMRSFIEAYEPKRLAVVNLTLEDTISVGATTVSFMTPLTFLDWLRDLR